MQTNHKIIAGNSNNLNMIPDESVHLIVSSPPYPMVSMWDDIFIKQNPKIGNLLEKNQCNEAFYLMHDILNSTWKECNRVLVDGGFICINIGDATRTIDGNFQLFSNHTEIIKCFQALGFTILPDIHWRKETNSPNKFMGSGMYPAGAYVTYEHEYILIFRKGKKRIFSDVNKEIRQKSAYFWEERNIWFSDVWDVKGTKQTVMHGDRQRNGSYPIDIPHRLINMYSIYGDTVLDPFSGLGTTGIAAMMNGRNSISIDISNAFCTLSKERMMADKTKNAMNTSIASRILQHNSFIEGLPEDKRQKCYEGKNHDFWVKTKQETNIEMYFVDCIAEEDGIIQCRYTKYT